MRGFFFPESIMGTLDVETRVRVFRNYTRNAYTVLSGTRVIASARQVRLSDVRFLVRESGRQRMLQRGQRNIHAYAVGNLDVLVRFNEPSRLNPIEGRRAAYDPLRATNFFDDETKILLAGAAVVQLDHLGMVYAGGRLLAPLAAERPAAVCTLIEDSRYCQQAAPCVSSESANHKSNFIAHESASLGH